MAQPSGGKGMDVSGLSTAVLAILAFGGVVWGVIKAWFGIEKRFAIGEEKFRIHCRLVRIDGLL